MQPQRTRRPHLPSALVLTLVGLILLSASPGAVAVAAPARATVPASSITADTTWRAADAPIDVTGYVTVERGATLTIEPGVEVRFAHGAGMTVAGHLEAVGAPTAPITLTGALAAPGSWQGLVFYGGNEFQATGTLRHATVEYGGFGSAGGNIYVNRGQVTISDSTLRRSGGAGLVLWSRAAGTTVTRSRIVENAGYGLFTPEGVARQAVLATNNWWGHPSGPAADNGCNAGGQGARVSRGVAVAPFLGAPDAAPSPLTPSAVRLLTLTPERWFAPADGLTRVYVTISARDGDGAPLPGRRVRLISTLGSVTDGGITDVQGRAFAWLSSAQAGDATLSAELDLDGDCEFARSGAATVTFSAAERADPLAPGAAAPYIHPRLSVEPRPLTRGTPSVISARLSNPGETPLVVEGRFSYAQSGIGLAFGPIGAPQTLTIAPGASVTFSTPFTPPIEGHFCLRFDYTYRAAGVQGLAAGGPPSGGGGDGGGLQENYEFRAPPLPKPLKRWQNNGDPDSDADDASQPQDEDGGGWFDFIPKFVDRFTDFDGSEAPPPENGGDGRGGLMAVTAAAGGPEYRQIATPRSVRLAERQAGGPVTPAIAAAQNDATRAMVEAIVNLEAASAADRRYAVATEARDLQWASLQASAAAFYEAAAGGALLRAADGLERYLDALAEAGVTALPVGAEQVQAYQARLRAAGFSAGQRAEMRLIGMSDAQIEAVRLRAAARPVERVTGDQIARVRRQAASLRALAGELLGGPALAAPAAGGATLAAGQPTGRLADLAELRETIRVGNPFDGERSIQLRVRALDLPPDWTIRVTPAALTLQPGEQRDVTVTIVPGTAVQGSVVQAAVEGYAEGALIDGVAFSVPVPQRVPLGAPYRVLLPLVRR